MNAFKKLNINFMKIFYGVRVYNGAFKVFALFFILFPINSIADTSMNFSFEKNISNNGTGGGWELHEWSGESVFSVGCKNDSTLTNQKNNDCLYINSELHLICNDCSYKFVYKYPYNVRDGQFLEWDWKAISLPEDGDVRYTHLDDQALQIYIYFDNGTALNYVWDSNAPTGLVVPRSYSIPRWIRVIVSFFIDIPSDVDVRHFVLKNNISPFDQWLSEKRNIVSDYQKSFGKKAPLVKGIGIQINSQHTGGYAEGIFRAVTLKEYIGRPPE